MNIFDNCRICLEHINHEPIKMTRIILKFIEKSLQMENVIKPSSPTNVKQNLCAVCFNKLSEFQDFHELCRDADEFWKNQFEGASKDMDFKDVTSFDATELMPLTDKYANTIDTTMATPSPTTEEQLVVGQVQQKNILPTPLIKDDAQEDISQIENFDNWPDEANECVIDVQDMEHNEEKCINDEIIEYDYQIDQGVDDVDIKEIPVNNEHVKDELSSLGEEYPNNSFVEIDHCSNDGTLIQESLDDILENPTDVESSFFLESSIDDSGKVKMAYKCQHCDKCFNRIYDIESHYNIHYDVKPYSCEVCGKSFRQKNILTTHQALHFGKKIECTECGKKFARKSQLILHYRMHRDEKPFECDFEGCKAAFRQRQHLMDHSFIHTGEKKFQCATCSKSFHTRKRLQDHIYKVHSQHRYRCDLCEKAFLKPHMLKNHMVSAHNLEMDDVSHLKTVVEPTMKKTAKKNTFNF